MRAILVSLAFFAVGAAAASPAAAQVQRGPWSGSVTTDSAIVKAKMATANTDAKLLVSAFPDLSDPIVLNPAATHATSNIASFNVSALSPDVTYYYAVREDGTTDLASAGKFSTFAAAPTSFTFAFGSCSNTGSNHPVFDHIRAQNPSFFLSPGDFHYSDISINSQPSFRAAYDTVMASPRQAELYRNVPIAYVWDDHDFGGNNSNKNVAARPAARAVYQEYVPHYALAAGSGNVPIDQSFSLGKARFILSDLRSERDSQSLTDNANKRMMSAAQLAWFEQEVLDAQAADQMVFWSAACRGSRPRQAEVTCGAGTTRSGRRLPTSSMQTVLRIW